MQVKALLERLLNVPRRARRPSKVDPIYIGCFYKFGVLFVSVLRIRAVRFEVHSKAPDCWKHPYTSGPKVDITCMLEALGFARAQGETFKLSLEGI